MIGQAYCIDIASTAVTTAVDLVEIQPADDRPVAIAAIFLHQTTDFGDAQDEVLTLQVIRGFTTSGSGGNTGVTPRPLLRSGAAAGMAVETMNTTVANTGTSHTLLTDGWNVRVPYLFQPIDDAFMPQAGQGDTTIVVRLTSTPADSITIRGSVWVVEQS